MMMQHPSHLENHWFCPSTDFKHGTIYHHISIAIGDATAPVTFFFVNNLTAIHIHTGIGHIPYWCTPNHWWIPNWNMVSKDCWGVIKWIIYVHRWLAGTQFIDSPIKDPRPGATQSAASSLVERRNMDGRGLVASVNNVRNYWCL